MLWLFLLILLLIVVGFLLLQRGRQTQARTGLPIGEVLYSDTGAEEAVEAPIISRRYGLVGKPDYLLHTHVAGKTVTIPIEVKSRRRPATIYQNHIMQLAVYCLLVEEKMGETPPHGLLRYADATFEVQFTESLRNQVLEAADAIRRARAAADLHRNHEDAERCLNCGYRHACGEAL